MPKRTSPVNTTPVRVVLLTLDGHVGGAVGRATERLRKELPGLVLSFHAASEWESRPQRLQQCIDDIGRGDLIIGTMLFTDSHVQMIRPALEARRENCDAMLICISAQEVASLTRLGKFRGDSNPSGLVGMLKRLRGRPGGAGGSSAASSGARQVKMLRRIPKLLRFVPGTAQDLRAYLLAMQYWLAGSEDNLANLVRLLVDRYAEGPRQSLRGQLTVAPPVEYPDVALYHPTVAGRVTERAEDLPAAAGNAGTVGLMIMRSYVLSDDAGHYDAVIAALEAKGLRVLPAYSSGLDARPAIEKYFMDADGRATVDALVSLTGFSLVGGPAYNDSAAAEELLARLDVPYIAAHALEFQSAESWEEDPRGLTPVESTIMVAVPEIDGATGPMVFGARNAPEAEETAGRMHAIDERVERLADRIDRLIALRRTPAEERRLAVVVFDFPPNSGATGTAAFLSVFDSLFHTLRALRDAGYQVDLPADADALRRAVTEGNAAAHGTDANVHAKVSCDDYVRRETHLAEIEAQWGSAPGRHQTDGRSIHVLGAAFGNVFVGVQPAFGYEGDPMRLLFEHGFAPTHAFNAFYRWIREDFDAHAVLHFGTHGALEFMPGKQTGLSQACWPDRLIGALPNLYLYAANNPSEGAIAKRRSAATLVSYLTPAVTRAGLYRGLLDLRGSIDRWRSLEPDAEAEREKLVAVIDAQAAELDLDVPETDEERRIPALHRKVAELEETLIPHGLHVVGEPMPIDQRREMVAIMAEAQLGSALSEDAVNALADGRVPSGTGHDAEMLDPIARCGRLLAEDHELAGLVHALDGGFTRPAPGGDLIRTPAILPTGRNVHGFDPYRLPGAFALIDGAAQAARIIARAEADGHGMPETVALVLWGTDNLKSEGAPIGQALALLGARPRFDGYARLAGAELIPLEELGRPRIDVIMTLSGIFRDLLPLQVRLLAEAAWLAASADEPLEQNAVRRHALAYCERNGCDFETAALRVFSNADGAYGSNVNLLVDSGAWSDEDELAETYTRRKCFAYGRDGKSSQQAELLTSALSDVSMAYQNLESLELGITTLDHYFDTLGGIGRAVRRARGDSVPVYIGDQTRGAGAVRTLGEQVEIETRTRILNPHWYDGMLKHGYEGVRQIEAHVTNTMGWSATTGEVAPWVYQHITQTYVLDPEMRERIAKLNPKASARVASRLLEAHERNYWSPDSETLSALREAGDELEDRLEGVTPGPAAA